MTTEAEQKDLPLTPTLTFIKSLPLLPFSLFSVVIPQLERWDPVSFIVMSNE
ncbi:MAG: hypothetical protein Fur0020_09140 [Thermodesulfovibrionia bacterium]